MRLISIIVLSLIISFESVCKEFQNVIQFSGIVVGGDSLYGLPGAYLYLQKSGRGTSTNETGFFSVPTLVGDTLSISAIGYKNKKMAIPTTDKLSLTVIIELLEDTTYYPIIEIFPYPTEDLFKQAFLSLKLPDNGMYNNLSSNIDPVLLQRMILNSAMSSSENHKYSLRSQIYPGSSPNYVQGFQLLNPFAWSNLMRSIKKGDAKKKSETDGSDQ